MIELKQALARSGFDESEVEPALERLRRERALDDGRFAAAFARSRLAGHGHGPSRIRADLRARGVARGTTEAALASAMADIPESEALDTLIRKLLRRSPEIPPEKRMRRIWATLLRRGFATRLVHERLAVLKPNWRDMIEGFSSASSETGLDEE